MRGSINTPTTKTGPKVRTVLKIFYALPVLFVLGVCGYLMWSRATHQAPPVRQMSSKPFASVPIAGLTANLFTQGDQLRATGKTTWPTSAKPPSNWI
jgi:flagellar basal body-associated protein FliL